MESSRRETNKDGMATRMMSLPVYYQIGHLRKDTKIHKEMNLIQYMRWMFVMHSSSRLSDIHRDLKSMDQEIQLDAKGLRILKYLNNKEHYNRIVERVVEAVKTKSQDLSITVCPTNNPDTCVHEIMQSGFAISNTVYAETLNSNVVIIFPENITPEINVFLGKKLPNLKHSKVHSVNYEKYISMDPTLLKLNEKVSILGALAKDFPKLTLKIINNDSASHLYICGSEQEMSSCLNTFENDYKNKIENKIVHLKIRKMDVFKETELFQILENRLEKNRCKCVLSLLQSSQPLQLTAYDANEIDTAERKLKKLVNEEKVTLTGKWKNATEMKRLLSMYKYEGVLLTLDEADAACFVTGLQVNVTKVVNELTTEMKETGEKAIVADRNEFRSDAGSKCSSETLTKHITPVNLKKPALCIEEMFDQEKERKTWIFPNKHKLVVCRKHVTQSEADILVRTMEVGNGVINHNIEVVQHANGQKTIEGNVFLPVCTRDKGLAERKLKAAFTSILKVAEKDNEESVAFPLTKVQSWPIEQIQRSLMTSCAEYFMAANENKKPRFVMICIDDKDLFPKYLESLGTFLQEFDTEDYIRSKETLRIFVEKGSLNEIQADVIVNTTSSNLDLKKGTVSAALSKTAGPGMQRECNKSHPRGVKAGDVVVTGGYTLKCNKVFHGTIPKYTPGKNSFEQITKFMHNCLVKAVDYKATTIAFPAIGTGNLQYPVEAVATEMFNCVREFQQSGHKTFLKEVLFVIYHSDDVAFEAFKKQEMATPDIDPIKTPAILELVGLKPDIEKTKTELRKKCDSPEGFERQTNRRPDETDTYTSVVARNGNKKEEIKKASIGSKVIPETLKRGSSSDAAAAEHKPVDIQQTKIKNPIGNIYPIFVETGSSLECQFSPNHETKIITTDILSIKDVEAIVCSENRYGTGLGKVSKKLETLGETKYTDDKYSAFKRNPGFGDVVITSGGRNRYKWILHAIVPDQYGEKGWKKTMQSLFDRMFEESSKRGFNSMATSLLGTGKFGGDPQRCAEVFLDSYTVACNRYHDKPLTLHMVNIDPNITQAVISVFKSHIKSRHDRGPVSAMPDVYDTQSFSSSSKRKPPRKPNTFDRTISDSSSSGTNSEAGLPDLKKKTTMVKKTEDVDDNCVICMDTLDDPKTLKCGHTFCTDCIDQQFKFKQACPTCGTICGIITGDQPDGKMEVEKSYGSLAGYQGIGSIVITYTFNSGQQSPTHPRPGTQYKGITRTAYLPDNEEGRQICAMLRVAFDRKLVFTIGASRTTGQEGVITWNDIHHKTDQKPNTQFGYPDATYLARVTDELGAKGVTKSDIEKKFLRILKSSLVGQRIK